MDDFLEYLRAHKSSLLDEWANKFGELSPAYEKIDHKRWNESSSAVFDAFCRILENNDFEPMRRLLEDMTVTHRFPGVSFKESQQAFSAVRYVLFPILIGKYQGDEFLNILFRINHAIDRIIFHFSDYFQKAHENKLKIYTNELEGEVKKRTLELEESRKNYQILFEEISDGCFVNQGGRIVFANKAFCEMHGYDREEMIGTQCEKLIADDSRNMVMERFYLHLKGIVPFETYIYCRQDKMGQRFPTENRVKLIKYNGKPAVLGLCTDITERMDMEQKIKQKDRMALIGRLSTSIAHEIRNPLSAIKVNIQLLLNKLDLEGNDLRRLQIAHEQSIQLESIVSQMMDFSRPIKLNYSMSTVHDLVEQATQLVEEKMERGHITLVSDMDSNLPKIMVDREKMIEAVSNVLSNAIEAFDGTHVPKTIECRGVEKSYHAKKHIQLSIIDNGVGIRAEDKLNVFEPFFTKGKKGGVGLGLSIVKKIVQAHNGRIRVKSEPGKTTSFTLMIPVDITQ